MKLEKTEQQPTQRDRWTRPMGNQSSHPQDVGDATERGTLFRASTLAVTFWFHHSLAMWPGLNSSF